MDRTSGANNIDLGGGKRGFRDRNTAAGQAGTIVDADWLNAVQEESVGIIERAGLTPDDGDRAQLRKALDRLFGGAANSFTANTTLTADHAGLVQVSAAGGNVTLTLPAANAANGRPLRYTIIRTDSSGNTLTIQRAGGDTLNGLTSGTIPVGASATLVSDRVSAWYLVAATGFAQTDLFAANGTATAPWWARRRRIRV